MASGRRRGSGGGKFAIGILVVALLIAMGVWIVRLYNKQAGYEQQLSDLQKQYEEETEKASELKEEEEYMQSTEYIKDTAEDKLGLSEDGQIIFKETESDEDE